MAAPRSVLYAPVRVYAILRAAILSGLAFLRDVRASACLRYNFLTTRVVWIEVLLSAPSLPSELWKLNVLPAAEKANRLSSTNLNARRSGY